MNDSVEELIAKVGGVPWGVNEWGSCQYTSALNMFNTLELLTKKYSKEEVFKTLHLRASHKGVKSIKTAWAQFQMEMVQRAREMDFEKSEMKALVSRFQKATPSVDSMFELCKSQAWDLWGTAPYVADLVFKSLNVEAPKAPGTGPSMNVVVQSENYTTGLCCWLLWEAKLIKGSPEKVFGHFDT